MRIGEPEGNTTRPLRSNFDENWVSYTSFFGGDSVQCFLGRGDGIVDDGLIVEGMEGVLPSPSSFFLFGSMDRVFESVQFTVGGGYLV